MTDDIHQLSIKELLTANSDYVIPMYQRNFAWDEGEITQLIQDVIDYLPLKQNYYIGTLVVAKLPERHEAQCMIYETIDGQQRLTTLSLLASYFKNTLDEGLPWYKELQIHFENRPNSSLTFKAIFQGRFKVDPSELLPEKDINTSILNGYRLIAKILPLKLKQNKLSVKIFAEYLFNRVQIMRVRVPNGTDLNHYFEIMNNRGEQLEKHEVLKARMLKVLNTIPDLRKRKASQNCLHRVWEACANMEKYVQLGFSVGTRNAIFGEKDWNSYNVKNFDKLCEVLGETDDDEVEQHKLSAIISGSVKLSEPDEDVSDEAPERFNTVINFPNFLLHVLRVVTGSDIPLNDNNLLATFDKHLRESNNAVKSVKEFIYTLLYCKYLFDQYVIKREFIKGEDGWSLKRFKWIKPIKGQNGGRGSYENTFGSDENINRRILMLLSAFHVSSPTPVYKYWLNAALNYLYAAETVEADEYLEYLESVAKSFVFDRILAVNGEVEYYDIIFENDGECQTSREDVSDDDLNKTLSFGQIENLVFNYLDYLLWVNNEKCRIKDKDKDISKYEFTFRSSVEHYYPQNPRGYDALPPDILHSFGNLCLISHSKNSRLSDFMPNSKKEYYQNNTIDSIKQHLMMQFENWNTDSINKHYDDMKEVLLNAL